MPGTPKTRRIVSTGSLLALLLCACAAAQSRQAAEKAIAAYEAAHPGVEKIGGDVKAASLARHVDPDFPKASRKSMSPIVVMMVVSEFGDVVDPIVVMSAHPDLDRRFLAAVRKWKYKPARKNGRPVKSFLAATATIDSASSSR